jgi:hypothetical protein
MPVLHRYKGKKEFYILTSINGNIVTFQLTNDGNKKLSEAGIEANKTFGRALLLDLVRSGQAYTHGTGPGTIESEDKNLQLKFDFSDDPEPESMFPSCSSCSSLDDLHLVEIKDDEISAGILCPRCRTNMAGKLDTSIPLFILTRGVLKRVLDKKGIRKIDSTIEKYQQLLDAEFQGKWEALIKAKNIKTIQENLFEKDNSDQPKLF